MPDHPLRHWPSTLLPRRALVLGMLSIASLMAAAGAFASPGESASTRPTDQPAQLPRDDIAWLQRIGFGIDSAELSAYRQLGRTRYLDSLLTDQGHDTLPPPIHALIDSYSVMNRPPEQLLADFRQQITQYYPGRPGQGRSEEGAAAVSP